MGIRAKFDTLINHRFAQINLPFVKSHISPTVNLDNMKLTSVFIGRYFLGVVSVARYVNLGRALHSQCFMRSDVVVFIPPQLELNISIVNVLHYGML